MKIKLTEHTETELNRLNNLYGDESSVEFDNWSKMSEVETLITDAGMYSDGAYVENDFTDLIEWCKATAECEYEEADGDLVKHKINKMIELGIIEII
jgi:hypothetical protein